MYRMMLEADAEGRDLRSVRVWASGADVMPSDVAQRFKRMGATASLPVVGGVGEAMFAEACAKFEESIKEGDHEKLNVRCMRTGTTYHVIDPKLSDEEPSRAALKVREWLGRPPTIQVVSTPGVVRALREPGAFILGIDRFAALLP